MAKNLIPEIAKMLGVELGEEFKIKDNTGTLDNVALNSVYAFVKHDSFEGAILTISTGEARPLYMPPRPLEPIALKVLELLCRGKCEIIKLPWKPKEDDTFYSFRCLGSTLGGCGYIPEKSDYTWRIDKCTWNDSAVAFALLKAGWVFRTRAEAEAALPAVAAEMGVEYEL